MPRSGRRQHPETGPGVRSGAADAPTPAPSDDRIRAESAAEHPLEAPGEDWSVLPRPAERTAPPRIQILNPAPMIDCGRFAAKRTVGEWVDASADVFRDGHEIMRAVVRYRGPGNGDWHEAPMRWVDRDVDGDRWASAFEVDRVGRWEFTFEAWSDLLATWRDELRRKVEAGQRDLRGELSEGVVLLEEARNRADGADRRLIEHVVGTLTDDGTPDEAKHDAVLGPDLLAAVERHPDRHDATRLDRILPLEVERERARFGAWYELFPRSFGGFEGVRRRLPKLAELGFDVIYLPPIHPIGKTNRKGRNNSLDAAPGDPGSPWAIGSEEGGHEAIDPELGTLDEFERLVLEARGHGLEIALDFAIQCSADHPWLREHPEWFNRRPRERGRCRHRARFRHPVRSRPPLARGAPRVVPAAPGRHAQVRGEPAQALPGHLQRQLGLPGLAGPLGGPPRRPDALDRTRSADIPRGQPAHQAAAVLGLADR